MWILAFISTSVYASTCATYGCVPTNTKTQCITHKNSSNHSEYFLTPCYPEYECPAKADNSNQFCKLKTTKQNYPGEFCSTDRDCTSLQCIANKCLGLVEGALCENAYDCNPGLYCSVNSKKCTVQKAKAQTCDNDASCKNDLLCIDNTCSSLFSVANNQRIEEDLVDSKTGWSPGCQTGYAVYNDGIYNCTTAPKSLGPLPVACLPGSSCVSSDGKYPKECECAINLNGTSFCPLFEGDDIVKTFIKDWLSLNALNSNCNAANPWGFECFASQSVQNQAVWYKWATSNSLYLKNYYPLIQGNDECAKQIFTRDYWELVEAQTDYKEPKCPSFYCEVGTDGWENEQCIFYQENIGDYEIKEILYVNECLKNQTCLPSTSSNSTCADIKENTRYPGDYCTKETQCISEICKNGACVGRIENDPCTNIYDCNPGLFCNTTAQTCKPQVQDGGECDRV